MLPLVQQEKPCPHIKPQPSMSCLAQAEPGDTLGTGRWLTPGQTLQRQSVNVYICMVCEGCGNAECKADPAGFLPH